MLLSPETTMELNSIHESRIAREIRATTDLHSKSCESPDRQIRTKFAWSIFCLSTTYIFVEILHSFLSLYQNPSHQYWWEVSSLILEYFHSILTSLHFQAHIFTRCSVANLIPRPPPIGYSHRQWTRINFARPNSLFRAKIMRVSEYPLAGMISLPNLPCLASKVNSKRRSTMDVR